MVMVVGKESFVKGFKLIGVKNIVSSENISDINAFISEVLESEEDFVILEGEVFNKLNGYLKDKVVMSSKPLFFVLSEEGDDQSIRFMIKRALGVDLENL